MIFAHFFANEKLNRYKAIVLAIGFVGLIFMIKPWNMQEGNTVIGMVYICLLYTSRCVQETVCMTTR